MENNPWLNLFGQDVRQRLLSPQDPKSVIYQAQPRSLVTNAGFSLIHPDYFKEALLSPILEKNITKITVPLNRIIGLNAIENFSPDSFNPETNYWDKDDQIIVNKLVESIHNREFDFSDTRGIYATELPGEYYLLIGGRHRIIALFLEGASSFTFHVNRLSANDEFYLNNPIHEYIIQKAMDKGQIIGKIIDDEDHGKKIIINHPNISNPLQLFGDTVSDELIDVLAQTLPRD